MTDTLAHKQRWQEILPCSWTTVTLRQVAELITGNTPSKKDSTNYGGFIPLVKPGELLGGPVTGAEDGLSEKGAKRARALPSNSVLVSCIGNLGKTGINRVPVAFNQQINAAIFSRAVVPEFGFYYMQADLVRNWMYANASATTVTIINKSKFGELPFPVPPCNEQCRIVEKIEELFTKLDAGVRSLKQAQALLKKYRQSVLKAAVEGELSREWREAHRDELEPASKLLERILEERREKFAGKKKHKEPASPDTSNASLFPQGWEWATVDQLSSEVRYGSSSKTNSDLTGIPVMRMGNIQKGQLVPDELKYLPFDHDEFPDLLLHTGDMLFNRTNSYELVGKTAVYEGVPELCSFASYLIRVRFINGTQPEFVGYFINSVYGRQWVASVVSQQVGQANVNGTKLRALSVPLPPLEEQRFIVDEVERRLSVIDNLGASIEANLKRSEGLRQSILKQAFSGRLVPQDPEDEPASALLERIRTEREKRGADKKKPSRKLKTSENIEELSLFADAEG